eukprot:EG_transcript_6854
MPKRKRRGSAITDSPPVANWEDPDGWLGFGAMLAEAGLSDASGQPRPKKKAHRSGQAQAKPRATPSVLTMPASPTDSAVIDAAAAVFGDGVARQYWQPLGTCFTALHDAVAEALAVLRWYRAGLALPLPPQWTARCADRLAAVLAQVEVLGPAHPEVTDEVATVGRTFRLLPAPPRTHDGHKGRVGRVRQALRLDALYYDLYCMARAAFPQYRPETWTEEPVPAVGCPPEPASPIPAPHEYFRALEALLYRHTTLPARMRALLASMQGPTTQPVLECWGVDPKWRYTSQQPPWLAQGDNPLLAVFHHRLSESLWLLEGMPTELVARWHQCARDWAARIYAFAIPTAHALRRIGTDVVEIGAATGFWSHSLQAVGARVLPLDVSPASAHERWCEVRRGSTQTLTRPKAAKYRTLLLCFPSPPEGDGTSMADEALAAFRGPRVCYVGEWATGMTASLPFHRRLAAEFDLEAVVCLPNWSQISADLRIFVRRPTASSSSTSPPLWCCAACGSSGSPQGLWRCPLVRQPIVCSDACLAKVSPLYTALRSAGGWPPAEPRLAAWERVRYVECKADPAAFAKLAGLVPNETRS